MQVLYTTGRGLDLQNMLLNNIKGLIFDFLIFCRDMAPFPQK